MSGNSKARADLVADIVAAYVSHNSVTTGDLPALIASTHSALQKLGAPAEVLEAPAAKLVPAVPIRKSITADSLVCVECGLKFKTLKRHLKTSHGMTPEQYREKWGLPPDYPATAPAYAEARSQLAKNTGLGQFGRRGSRKSD